MAREKPVRVELTDFFLPDNQLVRRVLAGEPAYFEILVHRHSERVYRAARAVLGDEEEAADVVQETFVRAYRKLGQFAGRARFSTWLTKIAVYEAGARRRKSRARAVKAREPAHRDPGNEPDTAPDPERGALVREVKALLEEAIEDLPDHYRTVFMMRVVEEASTAETAEVLNLSRDVVKTRLRRARALLRKKLHAAVGPLGREAFPFAGERCQRMWDRRILPVIAALEGQRR